MMPEYLALDLHRRSVHRCGLEPHPEGAQRRHSRFPNTREGWSRFIETETGPDTWVVFEVTGNAFEVHDLLSPHGGKVLLTKATAANERGSGRKTDRADAERLVGGFAQGTLPAVWVPLPKLRALRRLLRARPRRPPAQSRGQPVAGDPAPQLAPGAPPAGMGLGWRRDHPETLEELADADRIIALSALRQYRVLAEEVEALTAEIAARVQNEPIVRVLLTLPGVSIITVAHIYAYIGDPSRFPGPKEVARYAGLDPSVHHSGETNRRRCTSKHGCKPLRTALIEAAHSVARFDAGPVGQFFQRTREKAGYNKSITALARKLLIVGWKMRLTATPYRGARANTGQRKVRQAERKVAQTRDGSELGQRLLCREPPRRAPAAHAQKPQRRGRKVRRTPVPT